MEIYVLSNINDENKVKYHINPYISILDNKFGNNSSSNLPFYIYLLIIILLIINAFTYQSANLNAAGKDRFPIYRFPYHLYNLCFIFSII
jgi:hypothetical protein